MQISVNDVDAILCGSVFPYGDSMEFLWGDFVDGSTELCA